MEPVQIGRSHDGDVLECFELFHLARRQMRVARFDEIDVLALQPAQQSIHGRRYHHPKVVDAGLAEMVLVGDQLKLGVLAIAAEFERPAPDRPVDAQPPRVVAYALFGHDVLPDMFWQDDIELQEITFELAVWLLERGAQNSVGRILDRGRFQELVGGPEIPAFPFEHEVEGEFQILDGHGLPVMEFHPWAQLDVPVAWIDASPGFRGPRNDLEIGIDVGEPVIDHAADRAHIVAGGDDVGGLEQRVRTHDHLAPRGLGFRAYEGVERVERTDAEAPRLDDTIPGRAVVTLHDPGPPPPLRHVEIFA